MMVAAALLVFSVLLAPRLASRAAALPNEWAWAAGLRTAQDPLASEWAEDTLVLGIAGPAGSDAEQSAPASHPEGQRYPPTARAS